MPSAAAQNVLALSVGLTATMRKQAAKTNAEVSDLIKAHSGDEGVATSAAERQKVYNAILDKYKALAQSWGYSFDKAVEKQNVATAKATARALPKGRNHPKPLTADQKVTALNGRTVQKMVAAATQSMGENAVRHLRNAAVAVFNKAKIEGKTDREIQKALAEAWDAEAGDQETHRFVDKSGRSWSNAAYLQMLTRTTLATVHRNAEINTLVGNGCDLARISGDGGGEVCDACQRWEGKVVSLTGATRGFPTLDEAKADGLFHPNCVHRIEYLDEDEIEEALEASGQKKAAQEAAAEERKEDELERKRESAAKARAAKAAKREAEDEKAAAERAAKERAEREAKAEKELSDAISAYIKSRRVAKEHILVLIAKNDFDGARKALAGLQSAIDGLVAAANKAKAAAEDAA